MSILISFYATIYFNLLINAWYWCGHRVTCLWWVRNRDQSQSCTSSHIWKQFILIMQMGGAAPQHRMEEQCNQLWKGSGHWSLRANVFIITETPLLLSWSCSDSWTCKRFMLISLLYIGGIWCRGCWVFIWWLCSDCISHIFVYSRGYLFCCVLLFRF